MSEIKIFITGEAWQSLQLDIEGFDFLVVSQSGLEFASGALN